MARVLRRLVWAWRRGHEWGASGTHGNVLRLGLYLGPILAAPGLLAYWVWPSAAGYASMCLYGTTVPLWLMSLSLWLFPVRTAYVDAEGKVHSRGFWWEALNWAVTLGPPLLWFVYGYPWLKGAASALGPPFGTVLPTP